MARRFIAEEKDIKIEDGKMYVTGSEVKHVNVMRHKIGDTLQVNEYICKLLEIDKKEMVLEIVEKAKMLGVPKNQITLFQALLKADKMEYALQKSVEIGASKIVPLETKNIVIRLDGKDKIKKVERYNKISQEASKQCGRTDIVPVENVVALDKVDFSSFDAVILAYEAEENSLKNAIHDIKENKKEVKSIAVIIGPEGGFAKEEVEKLLQNSNVYSCSLGTRILRAETAASFLLSILIYELEL